MAVKVDRKEEKARKRDANRPPVLLFPPRRAPSSRRRLRQLLVSLASSPAHAHTRPPPTFAFGHIQLPPHPQRGGPFPPHPIDRIFTQFIRQALRVAPFQTALVRRRRPRIRSRIEPRALSLLFNHHAAGATLRRAGGRCDYALSIEAPRMQLLWKDGSSSLPSMGALPLQTRRRRRRRPREGEEGPPQDDAGLGSAAGARRRLAVSMRPGLLMLLLLAAAAAVHACQAFQLPARGVGGPLRSSSTVRESSACGVWGNWAGIGQRSVKHMRIAFMCPLSF